MRHIVLYCFHNPATVGSTLSCLTVWAYHTNPSQSNDQRSQLTKTIYSLSAIRALLICVYCFRRPIDGISIYSCIALGWSITKCKRKSSFSIHLSVSVNVCPCHSLFLSLSLSKAHEYFSSILWFSIYLNSKMQLTLSNRMRKEGASHRLELDFGCLGVTQFLLPLLIKNC